MKKIIAMLCAGVCALGMTACDGKDDSESQESRPSSGYYNPDKVPDYLGDDYKTYGDYYD